MASFDRDFEEFWVRYPRKVAKLAAVKAFKKARTQATQAELLHGIDEYVKHKPAYADFAHPASWLNSGRWLDDWTPPQRNGGSTDWFEECKQVHGGACGLDRYRHVTRRQAELETYRGKQK